jgi:hypothetical protein
MKKKTQESFFVNYYAVKSAAPVAALVASLLIEQPQTAPL